MVAKKDTYLRALARAEHICAGREYCEMDISAKLKNYELLPDELEEILVHLRRHNFIDNRRFARAFANDKYKFNSWGKIKIRAHLTAKNIGEQDIETALSGIKHDEYESIIWQELTRKWEQLDESDLFKKEGKLFRFAQSRGYEFEITQRFIDQHSSTF
ncbi:MAG: RecX family transcriptional regulator [Bacteroidetes bacterium]|jgi:regulatory protein|nr:RecX family transcriptional regulator [Bacteroidota bacterium]